MRVAAVATLSLVATAFGAIAHGSQTFRVGVEGVRVDVLVTDGNKPVAGLIASDFELRDSGVLQQIDSIGVEDVPLSVMFVLDTSFSMNGAPLSHLKEAAAAVVDLLMPEDRAAVLTFSGDIVLQAPWTSDHAALKRALTASDAHGGTSLYDAAYTALTLRDQVPGRPLALIFSDGEDTLSWLPGQSVLDLARRTEVVVYGVGLRTTADVNLGYQVDYSSGLQPVNRKFYATNLLQSFLSRLASDSGGKYLDAARSEKLRETFVQILTEFRSRYLLSYTPRGVEATGWHPLGVKLKNRKGKITARRGYLR